MTQLKALYSTSHSVVNGEPDNLPVYKICYRTGFSDLAFLTTALSQESGRSLDVIHGFIVVPLVA